MDRVKLDVRVFPLFSVDRLTELLLDSNSHKSTVTNGNQELSSESPVVFRCDYLIITL